MFVSTDSTCKYINKTHELVDRSATNIENVVVVIAV